MVVLMVRSAPLYWLYVFVLSLFFLLLSTKCFVFFLSLLYFQTGIVPIMFCSSLYGCANVILLPSLYLNQINNDFISHNPIYALLSLGPQSIYSLTDMCQYYPLLYYMDITITPHFQESFGSYCTSTSWPVTLNTSTVTDQTVNP